MKQGARDCGINGCLPLLCCDSEAQHPEGLPRYAVVCEGKFWTDGCNECNGISLNGRSVTTTVRS